jgi:cation diffusion facilitator family transporter
MLLVSSVDLAQCITIVSIIVTTTWGLLEILGWRAFGSVAFLAAGVDALFDTGTSLGVIAGLRISRRKADFGHPYGHYQAETLVSMALGAVLIFVALRVIFSAAERLRAAVFKAPTEAFLIALLSMPTFGTLAMKKIRIGKRTGNMSVVADGYHTLSDFFSSLAVFVGFVLTRMGYPQADPLVAFGISALIMWYGVSLLRKTANILMEASPSDAIMTEIRQITRKVPGVIDCHKCRARRVGSKIFADLHITVKADTRVDDAHKIATLVERRLKRKIKGLQSVIVHVEPHG